LKLLFHANAWQDYHEWQRIDPKMVRKINEIIRDILRTPYDGTGKPESLKYDWSGWWSRRIDREQRLVYRIVDDVVEIAQCRFHY